MFDTDTMNAVKEIAIKEGYAPAELLAIADVESAGVAFWNVNGKQLPAIRFEWSYFKARLNADELKAATFAGLNAVQPSSFAGRYDWLAKAQAINPTAALESVSMGLGQVMGANWKDLGYPSVDAMWAEAQTVGGQVELMVKFINHDNLKKTIDAEDWKGFAKVYNGPGYAKNSYDTKLAAAVIKYSEGIPAKTFGMDSDEVTQMQKMLNKLGDYNLTADGIFGNETKVAIRDFQLKNGLTVDGVYGPLTRNALQTAYVALSNKKTMNVGLSTTAVSTATAALTEGAKQIQSINQASWVIQGIAVVLFVLGVGITLKATVFNKTS